MLTACKNFLNAGKVKDEITSMIDYNNAPAYTIIVEVDRASGTLLKPITGEVKKKATDVFPVKFEPNEGYKFQKWEATCTDALSENDSISNYIVFEDETSLETNVTFKKGLKNIVIRPVCPAIPDAQIKIDGDNGNFSPSKGVYTKKAGSITSVIFDAQTDYEFIRWQILDEATGAEIPNGKYLLLENPTESRTNFEVVDTPDPDSGITLLLKPVTMERPQVLSWGPDTKGERTTKDASIQVVFDREIDENSIYYTDDDVSQIEATTPNIYWWNSAKNGKPYAYKNLDKENPIKVYKNIVIRYDDDPKSNINICYGEPVFDNPRSITLPVDRSLNEDDLPKDWSSILVSFEKGFFYYVKISDDPEIKKPVKMSQSKRWIYEVNNKTDTEPPVLKTNATDHYINADSKTGNDITGKQLGTSSTKLDYSTIQTLDNEKTIYYTNKIAVKFNLTDTNGLTQKFEVHIKKAYDEYYKSCNETLQPLEIAYHSTGKNAFYEEIIDFSSQGYNLSDGLYQIYFKFKDACGNPCYYPDSTNKDPPTTTFNICIDNGTHISMPEQTITQYEEKMVLKLADSNQILPGDLKSVTVYNDSTTLKTFSNTGTPINIADLTDVEINELSSMKTYNIKVEYVDYKDQTSTEQFSYTTLKPTITPKHLDFTNGNLFSVLDLGLSSIPDLETVTLLVTVEKLDSNNNYVPITPSANGKYEIKEGNVYHIKIDGRKNGSSINRIYKEYTMFTKPKPLDVRFTPVFVENPKDNECIVHYSIVRTDDEYFYCVVNNNIINNSGNTIEGYVTLSLSTDETITSDSFNVTTQPPVPCDISDATTFSTYIPIIPYGIASGARRETSTGKLSEIRILETKEFVNTAECNRTINIIYNGRQIASDTLTGTETELNPLVVTIASENIISSTSPLEGISFIIESIDDNTNQYIARQEYIYSYRANPVLDLSYSTSTSSPADPYIDYTLTWTNPAEDKYCGLQVSASFKWSKSGKQEIIGPFVIDKNATQYTFEDIPSRSIEFLQFTVSTTNYAGDLRSTSKPAN